MCAVCGYYKYHFSVTTGETVTFHDIFADALDKASDGSVIKLLKNYSDDEYLTIEKAVTLDLNGKQWMQPSLGYFTVNAKATFTDSVGGGYLDYGLKFNSAVTLRGGSYRYVMIEHDTDDTLDDYLDKCCGYYSYWEGELLDLSTQQHFYEAVTVKENHTEKIVNAIEATTTQKGYTGDTVCSVWGLEIAKGKEIPQLSADMNTDTNNSGTNNSSPKTGDSSQVILWSALLFISGLGTMGAIYYGKRKKII